MFSNLRTYLFDLDGTLVDSVDLILDSFRHAYQRVLKTTPDERLWRASIGRPLREQFAEISPSSDGVEHMIEAYREFYIQHHDARVKAFPRAREILVALRDAGALVGLVTSKSRVGTDRTFRACHLGGLFDAVVTADDVDQGKPHPEPVHLALEQLGVPAKTAVFIGDSPHDVAAGREAGVRTVAVLWGIASPAALENERPDGIMSDLSELWGLVPNT